jgi:excinuclease ABC subunit C
MIPNCCNKIARSGSCFSCASVCYTISPVHSNELFVKDAKRLEEIYVPEDPIPLYLDKKSETLKILQRVRDESHRFGVKHHRTRRKNSTIKTELEEIPGIGEKAVDLLLSKLKSVKRVKESSRETLEEILGKNRGGLVWEYFNSNL